HHSPPAMQPRAMEQPARLHRHPAAPVVRFPAITYSMLLSRRAGQDWSCGPTGFPKRHLTGGRPDVGVAEASECGSPMGSHPDASMANHVPHACIVRGCTVVVANERTRRVMAVTPWQAHCTSGSDETMAYPPDLTPTGESRDARRFS